MEEEAIDELTKMAHLLETHPETSYNGELYADSLGLRYDENSPELYNEEVNLLEDEIKETASNLNNYGNPSIPENLENELESMLEEASKAGSDEISKYHQQKYIEDAVHVIGGAVGQVLAGVVDQLGEKYLKQSRG